LTAAFRLIGMLDDWIEVLSGLRHPEIDLA
jgi:hypothetical protein